MSSITKEIKAKTVDVIQKTSNATSRSGHATQRVAYLCEMDVDREVTALQMTKTSPNGFKYTESDVESYEKLYQDSKSGTVLSAQQTLALATDQKKVNEESNNDLEDDDWEILGEEIYIQT